MLSTLNPEQRLIHDEILRSERKVKWGFYFMYGYGDTGKTYVWNILSAAIRSHGKIVINVASRGITSLLLPGGRTAHSKFSIPLNINEFSTCNINQGSLKAELLQQTSLIIWDEAPILKKQCFEALDRTLRDIRGMKNESLAQKSFGGIVVVLGVDFRQILPVVPRGTRHDIISVVINSSYLWEHCKILRLSSNMRLLLTNNLDDSEEIRNFAKWILKICDGEHNMDYEGKADVKIPDELLILNKYEPMREIVKFTYRNLVQNMEKVDFFQDRTILAPTNDAIETMNSYILSLIPGEEHEYLSSDSTCICDEDLHTQEEWFTTEFLNEIKCSEIPNHRLIIKKCVPIMLLRNIDQCLGLCNGMRLVVNDLGKNVIGATVITGTNVGDKIYISRMNLVPTDSSLPVKFQMRQFPVALCLAMTINKSHGRSLSHVGIFLPKPVFTHGQLYVAVSRVKAKECLKILILDENDKPTNVTKNVVYKQVFERL